MIAEQEVQTGSTVDLHFGLDDAIAAKFFDRAGFEGVLDQAVGVQGLKPHPAASNPDHLERLGKFSFRVVARGAPDLRAGRRAAEHGTWVWAVDRDLLAVSSFDIC